MNAGIQIKLEPFGFERAEATIAGILLKAGHLRSPFESAGKFLVTRTHEHFEHERSPEGEPWAALSAAYVARPKEQGGRGGAAHPILFVQGYLEASINYKAGDAELAVGTNRKFPGGMKSAAAIHQLGGEAGRGHRAAIPARPFLGVDSADEERISDVLVNYLAKL
jgi:phage virion morphogenesis protein